VGRRARNFGATVPAETQREIVRLYQSGESMDAVAARVYWSAATVHAILANHGVPSRHGGSNGFRLHEDELFRTVELYQSGKSIREVAEEVGLTYSAVHERLRRAGVQPRSPGRSRQVRRAAQVARDEAALTDRQATLLRILTDALPDHVTTADAAKMLGVPTRYTRNALRQLEAFGLVTTARRGKWTLVWTRTSLPITDVLDAALDIRNRSALNDAWLPVGPFREWVEGLLARERRASLHVLAPRGQGAPYRPAVRHSTPGHGGGMDEGAHRVAARLGLTPRRLYAVLHEQATVGLSVADRAITGSGEPVRLEDLWPWLEDGLPASQHPHAHAAPVLEGGVCGVCLREDCTVAHGECSPGVAA